MNLRLVILVAALIQWVMFLWDPNPYNFIWTMTMFLYLRLLRKDLSQSDRVFDKISIFALSFVLLHQYWGIAYLAWSMFCLASLLAELWAMRLERKIARKSE